MTEILLVASLTLLASFLCSLFEAALYSVRPSQIEVLKERGAPGADRLARLRDDIEAPVAAILTVNTAAHTVGASWCGAMVAVEFGNYAIGAFAALFTVLVLAVTEIVPKSLGVRFAATLAPRIVWPLQIMIWSVWPVVWLARCSMRLITRRGEFTGPSEEELIAFAGLASTNGTVRTEERRWVENALRLDQFTAADLRTPRTVVERFPARTRVAELGALAARWTHSRIPVTADDDPDEVVGIAHRREVFDAALANERTLTLGDLLHPARFVPSAMRGHQLLSLFLDERVHLAIVVDEYGVLDGVVTLEDVLECLLGEKIVDEHDQVEDLQKLALARSPLAAPDGVRTCGLASQEPTSAAAS